MQCTVYRYSYSRLWHKIYFDFLYCRVVEFASSRDMKAAMKKLQGSTLYGKRIHLVDVSVNRMIFYVYHFSFIAIEERSFSTTQPQGVRICIVNQLLA